MQCDELAVAIIAYQDAVQHTPCMLDSLAPVERHIHTEMRAPIPNLDGAAVTGTAAPRTKGGKQRPSAWSKYSSIENCCSENQVEAVRCAVAAELGANSEWIASEKVHGANFCFETDGNDIRYASRTSTLGNDADFFSARATMPKYHACVLEAFRLEKERCPNLTHMLIYGEYFGGYYPGHRAEPGMKKVQIGVAYSPGHHFYAFDVARITASGMEYHQLNSPKQKELMDFDEARALLLAAGFPLVAAPIWRGALDELLAINVEEFETTLPALLGHPRLDRFRIAEGIIIRPVKEVRFGTHRAILKKKSQAFWEATNQPGQASKVAAQSQAKGAFAGCDELLDAVRCLANVNRLRAVISKDPTLLQHGQEHKLAGLFGKDILEDLQKQYDDKLQAYSKVEVSALKKSLQFMARAFVQEHVGQIREEQE